jgi:hypothetical protein
MTCSCREALEKIILPPDGQTRSLDSNYYRIQIIAREALAKPCECEDERQRLQRQLSEIVRNAAALRRQRSASGAPMPDRCTCPAWPTPHLREHGCPPPDPLTDLAEKAKRANLMPTHGNRAVFFAACSPERILALVKRARELEAEIHALKSWANSMPDAGFDEGNDGDTASSSESVEPA